jgi:hypothetical protein
MTPSDIVIYRFSRASFADPTAGLFLFHSMIISGVEVCYYQASAKVRKEKPLDNPDCTDGFVSASYLPSTAAPIYLERMELKVTIF